MAETTDRRRAIELLLLDVDGVLTDGSITYSELAGELKSFHVRDGSAIHLWHLAGKKVAIVSGRRSPMVERRAAELGIEFVHLGYSEKLPALERVLEQSGFELCQVAAMGDDIPDLPVLRSCGLAISVRDACPEVVAAADYVTMQVGGRGAVREAVEWLLRGAGLWPQLIERYQTARLVR